jgi:acyl carrier protein
MPASNRTEIREQLLKFLIETFPLFIADAPDDLPVADHGVDSLGLTNIVLFLEQHFQIGIDDSEITRANLGTVKTLVDFVERKINS